MHINKGKNIAECLTDRIDYSKNPEKTRGGELISAWQCDPKTADAEFLFSKRQYRTLTGREQQNDVIAYQVRQSFKPGEITPEEANRIGYEFAVRFLKGKHAFTGLDEVVYRRAVNGADTRPSIETIVAFSCGLDLDIQTAEKIMQLASHAFDESDLHRAYKFCIGGLSGHPIEDRNTFLESYGYPPLGTKQKK